MSDLSFQNNVPDPLLSGKELPTFKFELEKSKGKVMRKQFWQGSDCRTTSHLQGNRRCINATRARRDARASLARYCGRVGVRAQRQGSHNSD